MKTLLEKYNECNALTERLTKETPTISSITFQFDECPLKDLEKLAEQTGKRVVFAQNTCKAWVAFCTEIPKAVVFFYSKIVKIKEPVLYEEVEETLNA